jgi:hypothetical protein
MCCVGYKGGGAGFIIIIKVLFEIQEERADIVPYLVTQAMEMARMMDVLEANFARWGLRSPRRLPMLF